MAKTKGRWEIRKNGLGDRVLIFAVDAEYHVAGCFANTFDDKQPSLQEREDNASSIVRDHVLAPLGVELAKAVKDWVGDGKIDGENALSDDGLKVIRLADEIIAKAGEK